MVLGAHTGWLGHSSSHVLLRTPIAPLSRWYSVPLYIFIVLPLTIALVEILTCAILFILLTGTIEVIEHQVHIFSLLRLQVIDDCFISMDLYFYTSICLS